MIERIEKPQSR